MKSAEEDYVDIVQSLGILSDQPTHEEVLAKVKRLTDENAELIKGDSIDGRCGCGRKIRYSDLQQPSRDACNKYMRCSTRNELEAMLIESRTEGLKSNKAFEAATNKYSEALAERDAMREELAGAVEFIKGQGWTYTYIPQDKGSDV